MTSLESFVERVRRYAYDILGVFFPGFAGLVLLAPLGLYLAFRSGSGFQGIDAFSWVMLTTSAAASHPIFTLFSLLFVSYFYGYFLFSVSTTSKSWWERGEDRLDRRALWIRALLLGSTSVARKFSKESELLIPKVLERLRIESSGDPLVDWERVFRLARATGQTAGRSSLQNTHQNKYTMYRSLGTAFALGIWSIVVAVAVSCLDGAIPTFDQLMLLLALVGAYGLMLRVFCRAYEYHWRLFGDEGIAEALIAPANVATVGPRGEG